MDQDSDDLDRATGVEPSPIEMRPATDVMFALIDGRPVLFSEGAQSLFELNDIAAFIWCNLEDGVDPKTICDQLVDRGLGTSEAHASLREVLRQWLDMGWVMPHIAPAPHAFTATIGKYRIKVSASDAELGGFVQSLFVAASAVDDRADVHFELQRLGATAIVIRDGRRVLSCPVAEITPCFRAYAIEQFLLAEDQDEIIFHGAAVRSGADGLLISAPPGTGKSTLTLHLLNAGFGFASDDMVLIAPTGEVTGVPLAPTLKSGAWPMVDGFRPDLGCLPVHLRSDDRAVRYLDVGPDFQGGPVRVKWIIFLERSPAYASPALTALNELETLQRIIDASYANQGRLSGNGFRALTAMVSRASAYVLSYAEVGDATDRLVGLCDGE